MEFLIGLFWRKVVGTLPVQKENRLFRNDVAEYYLFILTVFLMLIIERKANL